MRPNIQIVMPDNSGTPTTQQAIALKKNEILAIDASGLTQIAHELINCPCGPHYIIVDHWGIDIDKNKKGRRRKFQLQATATSIKTDLIEEIRVREIKTKTSDSVIHSIPAECFWGANNRGVLYADLAIRHLDV